MPTAIQRVIANARQKIIDHQDKAKTKASATHADDPYQAQNFFDALVLLHHKYGDGKKLRINHGPNGAYLSKQLPNWVKKIVYGDKIKKRSEVVQSVARKGLDSNNPLAQQAARDLLSLTANGIVNGPELRTAAWTIQNPGKSNPYDEQVLSAPQVDSALDKAHRHDVDSGAFDKADEVIFGARTVPVTGAIAVQDLGADDSLDLSEAIDGLLIDIHGADLARAIQLTIKEVADSLLDGGNIGFARTLLTHLPEPPDAPEDQRISDLDKLSYYLDKTDLKDKIGMGDLHALNQYRIELQRAQDKARPAKVND